MSEDWNDWRSLRTDKAFDQLQLVLNEQAEVVELQS
jgi:hypothetical protein